MIIEPPNDSRIYNRRQEDGTLRTLDNYFMGKKEPVTIFRVRGSKPIVTGIIPDRYKSLFEYAVNAYGYLLTFYKRTTCGEFAQLIKETYSLEESHNSEVYNMLIRLEEIK